jgi:hypothetical protein
METTRPPQRRKRPPFFLGTTAADDVTMMRWGAGVAFYFAAFNLWAIAAQNPTLAAAVYDVAWVDVGCWVTCGAALLYWKSRTAAVATIGFYAFIVIAAAMNGENAFGWLLVWFLINTVRAAWRYQTRPAFMRPGFREHRGAAVLPDPDEVELS